ncbi:hypothetical protein ACFV1C_40355, partial [Streptomyces sp. NPDC059605]|uniref:hypothetical protein n=1 Tax=Streptomyces sp. NPDC059605 TaxID=3346882 RepID=UPI0036A7278E
MHIRPSTARKISALLGPSRSSRPFLPSPRFPQSLAPRPHHGDNRTGGHRRGNGRGNGAETEGPSAPVPAQQAERKEKPAADQRAAKKELQRLERQLDKISTREQKLHTQIA